MNHSIAAAALVFSSCVWLPARAAAQDRYAGTQAVAPVAQPSLTAELVDAEKKAAKKSATVSVEVKGIKLVDPDSTGGKPLAGQGHLHYRLDGGPIIATTATKLSFHDLSSGSHTLNVVLAANDHSPLGPSATLAVVIP